MFAGLAQGLGLAQGQGQGLAQGQGQGQGLAQGQGTGFNPVPSPSTSSLNHQEKIPADGNETTKTHKEGEGREEEVGEKLPSSGEITPPPPPHILIVDDSQLCQKIVKKILTSCDYTYETAFNGKEAVDKLGDTLSLPYPRTRSCTHAPLNLSLTFLHLFVHSFIHSFIHPRSPFLSPTKEKCHCGSKP